MAKGRVLELVAEIEAGWTAITAALDALPVEEWEGPRSGEGWTVKDHVAHLEAWEAGMVALLQKGDRAAAMGVSREQWLAHDLDATNEAITALHRAEPVVEVRARFAATHAAMLAVLRGLEDDDLDRTYSYYQPGEPGTDDGAPISRRIEGNTVAHWQEHFEWIESLLEAGPKG